MLLEFFVPFENFSLIWRVTIAGDRLQMLIYTRLLNSEGSIFKVPRATLYKGHFRGPATLIPIAEGCHYLFLRLRSVAAVIRTPNLPLAGPTLYPTTPPPRFWIVYLAYQNILILDLSSYIPFHSR